jgi:hypothetical protein
MQWELDLLQEPLAFTIGTAGMAPKPALLMPPLVGHAPKLRTARWGWDRPQRTGLNGRGNDDGN